MDMMGGVLEVKKEDILRMVRLLDVLMEDGMGVERATQIWSFLSTLAQVLEILQQQIYNLPVLHKYITLGKLEIWNLGLASPSYIIQTKEQNNQP